MSETQQKLMHAAADECMSPEQRDLFDALGFGDKDSDIYARLFRCVMKRAPEGKRELAAYMVRHKDFRDNESLWRCIEMKFADKYRADENYDMKPLYFGSQS